MPLETFFLLHAVPGAFLLVAGVLGTLSKRTLGFRAFGYFVIVTGVAVAGLLVFSNNWAASLVVLVFVLVLLSSGLILTQIKLERFRVRYLGYAAIVIGAILIGSLVYLFFWYWRFSN